jgi:hypothetical protein
MTETVDIRLRAEENWKRRLTEILAEWAVSVDSLGTMTSPDEQIEQKKEGRKRTKEMEEQDEDEGELTLGDLPTESLECSLLHRVSDDLSVFEDDESVRRGEGEGGFARSLLDGNELLGVGRAANQGRICQLRLKEGLGGNDSAYSIPAIPSTTRSSPVMVPVLSKQQTSTRPANEIRKGSVQKMAKAKDE